MCRHIYDWNIVDLDVRGRPFDPEGGGGLALLVGTDYLFSSQARPENLFPGKPRTEYLFSTAANFWKGKNKKMEGGGEGRLVRGFSRGGQDMAFYVLHYILQTNST